MVGRDDISSTCQCQEVQTASPYSYTFYTNTINIQMKNYITGLVISLRRCTRFCFWRALNDGVKLEHFNVFQRAADKSVNHGQRGQQISHHFQGGTTIRMSGNISTTSISYRGIFEAAMQPGIPFVGLLAPSCEWHPICSPRSADSFQRSSRYQ